MVELVNHGMTNEEEEATFNVYQTIQNMENIFLVVQTLSPIFGVEYHVLVQTALLDHNVPCAVCHVSTRAAVLMIPAWRHCPSQWTLEYTGYLMTEYITHIRVC